ncbi:hypothetical protein RB195_024361 [Necator americanus]|uniref:Uncharacterized protein n=1 Tax=Necator americanus TaxID=51031 RepID=A0ABR1EMV4_NECAM
MVDQVVKCEIDGNGVPPTSSAVRLANSNVAFGQMVSLLMLVLVIWLLLLSIVAFIICLTSISLGSARLEGGRR